MRTASAELHFVWSNAGWKTLQANPLIQQIGLTTLRALAKNEVRRYPSSWQRNNVETSETSNAEKKSPSDCENLNNP